MSRHLIDAHLHVWERARHPQPWIDPQTMSEIDRDYPPRSAVETLTAHGVDAAVVVQCVNELSETVDLLADATGLPAVRGVVGWVDLTADVARRHESTRFVLDHLGKVPMTSTTPVTWARELAGGYGSWLTAYLQLTADLEPHEQTAIDGANARRVYGLA